MNEQLLTVNDLCKLFKLSRGAIYRLIRVGTLPHPVRLSARCVRWRGEDISAAVEGLLGPSRGGGVR